MGIRIDGTIFVTSMEDALRDLLLNGVLCDFALYVHIRMIGSSLCEWRIYAVEFDGYCSLDIT